MSVQAAEHPASSQFSALPRGHAGRLAGAVMALENRTANRVVVEVLDLGRRNFVLELGCGPGVALAQLGAEQARFTVGADPSDVMVAQARRRLRSAVERGRAEVCRAEAAWLPYDDDFFTCALALHTIHHWPCVSRPGCESCTASSCPGRSRRPGRPARPAWPRSPRARVQRSGCSGVRGAAPRAAASAQSSAQTAGCRARRSRSTQLVRRSPGLLQRHEVALELGGVRDAE